MKCRMWFKKGRNFEFGGDHDHCSSCYRHVFEGSVYRAGGAVTSTRALMIRSVHFDHNFLEIK